MTERDSVQPWMKAARDLAKELRRRCNTRMSLLHQSAWYEAANELEKFAAQIIAEHAKDQSAPTMNRFELIDWTADGRFGCGRVKTIWESPDKISIKYAIQDRGRTLKVFVSDAEASQSTPDKEQIK